jgi:hypothetical protein
MEGQFFLKFPRPSTPEKPDVDPNHLAPLKTHGSKYSPLVSTSKIFFGCGDVLGIFPASNSKTLKSSLFFHPHSTDFHHFHLSKEDHDKQNGNNGSILQEPLPQYCKQPHKELKETKVSIGYHLGTKHSCQQEGLQYYLRLQPCRTAVHNNPCQVIGGQIPPVPWPCQQQYHEQSLEPHQVACNHCDLHGEYPRTFNHMELAPGTTNNGVQPAAKKPAPPPPCIWSRSRAPSAAHGHTRTNTPQGKRTPTNPRDPSKPPTSSLRSSSLSLPPQGKVGGPHLRPWQQHHLPPLPQLPRYTRPQKIKAFPHQIWNIYSYIGFHHHHQKASRLHSLSPLLIHRYSCHICFQD